MSHVLSGHKEKLPEGVRCSVCDEMDGISVAHRRQEDDDAVVGVMAADLKGPLPKSRRFKSWLLAALARDTKVTYTKTLPNKSSLLVDEAIEEMGIDWRRYWRFHSDGGTEFLSHLKDALRSRVVVQTDTGGYEPRANGDMENALFDILRIRGREAVDPVETRAA